MTVPHVIMNVVVRRFAGLLNSLCEFSIKSFDPNIVRQLKSRICGDLRGNDWVRVRRTWSDMQDNVTSPTPRSYMSGHAADLILLGIVPMNPSQQSSFHRFEKCDSLLYVCRRPAVSSTHAQRSVYCTDRLQLHINALQLSPQV